MALLDNATNLFGPLTPLVKARIMAFMDNPCAATWDNCASIIVNKRGIITVWQALLRADPSFPHSAGAPTTSTLSARWHRVPDPFTVARAIREATT